MVVVNVDDILCVGAVDSLSRLFDSLKPQYD